MHFNHTVPPPGFFVETKQGPVHVVKSGTGSQPLIYIHGNLGAHQDFYLSPLKELLAENYTVYALDRPGAGHSPRPARSSYTLQDHAEVISEVVTALNLDKPLIMGHSYGGAVAMMFALYYPEDLSGLFLISPAVHDWEGDGVSEFPLFTTPVIGDLLFETIFIPAGKLLSRPAYKDVFAPAEVPEDYFYISHRYALVPSHFRSAALDMQLVRPGLRYIAARYANIKIPAGVIVGGMDKITPYWNHGERLKKHLPDAIVKLIPEAGHQPHFSHPNEIVSLLDELFVNTE